MQCLRDRWETGANLREPGSPEGGPIVRNEGPIIRNGARSSGRGPDRPEWSPEHEISAYMFVFPCSIFICRCYKLTISDQIQVSLQLTVTFPI